MSPLFASMLCFSLIIYLFYTDYNNQYTKSLSIWIPIIFLQISASRPISFWIADSNYSGVSLEVYNQLLIDGSPIDRIFYSLVICIGLFILIFKRRLNWINEIRNNPWIYTYFAYAAISILWSEFPIVSAKRWIKEFGIIIMVLIIVSDDNPIEKIKMVIRTISYILIPISFLFIKYIPIYGRYYDRWTHLPGYSGVADNKNLLGVLLLISGIYIFWEIFINNNKFTRKINSSDGYVKNINEKIKYFVLFIIIIWLFDKADSATSLVCFIISLISMNIFNMSIYRENIVLIQKTVILTVILCISIIIIGETLFFEKIIELTGHSETFMSRVELWQVLLGMSESPWIGTGFDSFWLGNRLITLGEKYWWLPNEAHNGFIEIYLNLGVIGLMIITFVYLSAFKMVKRQLKENYKYGLLLMALFISSILYNISEAAFRRVHVLWIIFILITYNFSENKNIGDSKYI